MKEIKILKNSIQEYAWGSFTAIPDLLGLKKPSVNPMAELWMGAHPKSSSEVDVNGKSITLIQLIDQFPEDTLGENAAEKFGNRLPYLFKVLAAGKPLSIQAHPDSNQAKAGFEKENRLGIPLDAPHRNYRDANHKPECICALTDFWALCGFRKIRDTLSYLNDVCPKSLGSQLDDLYQQPDNAGLKNFFSALMTISDKKRKEVVGEAIESARPLAEKSLVFDWMLKLHKEYQDDIGVLSPAFLNLICLKPGDALFLNAGELHAYLAGTGIELMANSDNVLRGGLTPKHVDVQELLSVLTFEEKDLKVIVPDAINAFEKVYSERAEEFVLSVISVKTGETYTVSQKRTAEILLCVDGGAVISGEDRLEEITLNKGVSVFVPAAAGQYRIEGEARIYRAAI